MSGINPDDLSIYIYISIDQASGFAKGVFIISNLVRRNNGDI